MQWPLKLNLRLNHYNNYRLCDQRMPRLQECLGELATLEKCCNVDVHVMHTTIAILWPFASGNEAEISTLLKCLNRDIQVKHGTVTHTVS